MGRPDVSPRLFRVGYTDCLRSLTGYYLYGAGAELNCDLGSFFSTMSQYSTDSIARARDGLPLALALN